MKRLRLLVIRMVAVVGGLLVSAGLAMANPFVPFVYVSSSNPTIATIDAAANAVVGSIPVGSAAGSIAPHPDGSRLYATVFTGIKVIDIATQTVTATIPVAANGYLAVNPAGTRLYVADVYSNTVKVIDTGTNELIATIPAPRATNLVVKPDGTRVYVTDQMNLVHVLDATTNTFLTSVTVGNFVVGIAVHPAGTFVYTGNANSNTVSVISTATNAVVATIPVGPGPGILSVHPAGTFVYSTSRDQVLRVIRTSDNVVVATVPLGALPPGSDGTQWTALTPDGSRLYVSRYTPADVKVVDTVGLTVLATVPIGATRGSALAVAGGPSPVMASAGPDQTVDEGALVALDGSASAGTGLSYAWEQVGGQAVALSGADTATPTFVAPTLPGGFGSQTLTFQLVVSRGAQSSTDTVNITVVNVNHAPIAHAGDDQGVREGSPVALSAALSFDPDGDPIAYAWVQTGGLAVTLSGANTATPTFIAPMLEGGVGSAEVLTFQVTVSDGPLSSSDDVRLVVEQDNHAPVANAGAPQTVSPGVTVTLDGSASSDPDNDPILYSWSQVGGPAATLANANTAAPSFTAPPANGAVPLTFQLTVTDTQLTSEPSEVVVTVNNGPPLCELARAVPNQLWPPDHKMVPIRIVGVTDPEDTAVTLTVTSVTQDEPVDGLGDGDTAPDAVITADSVLLRAERGGLLNGRVYQVHFAADDGQGGVCSGAVNVWVPKSKKAGEGMLDDGQSYDSTQP